MDSVVRSRIVTGSLVALVMVAVVDTALRLHFSWGGWAWLPATLLAVPGVLLVIVRNRHPLAAVLIGTGVAVTAVAVSAVMAWPAAPGPAVSLTQAILVATAIRALSDRLALAIATGSFVVVPLAQALNTGSLEQVTPIVVWSLACWITGTAVGAALRLSDVRRLAATREARHQMRLELARELHDVVAHHVAGIALQAQAGQLVADDSPAMARAGFAEIERAAAAALSSMRHTVGRLRQPHSLGMRCDEEAVTSLVTRCLKPQTSCRVTVSRSSAWPPEHERAAVRILQEALTNIARHAHDVSCVQVVLQEHEDHIFLEVLDDGRGSALAKAGGFGLIGMRERAELVGGHLSAGPNTEDRGWRVTASLPHRAGALS